jgi:hypothetical protein
VIVICGALSVSRCGESFFGEVRAVTEAGGRWAA